MEDPAIERVSHIMDLEDTSIAIEENTFIVNAIVADTNFSRYSPTLLYWEQPSLRTPMML